MKQNYRVNYDESVKCDECGRIYRLLHWQCMLHRLTCGPQIVPQPEQARIIESAKSHGITIFFF